MTVLVSDSFNRADSSTTLGSTDSYNGGTVKTWVNQDTTGTWGISTQHAVVVTDSTNRTVAVVPSSVSDGIVECDINWVSGAYLGLTFRNTDRDNMFDVGVTSTGLILRKYVTGTSTTLGTYSFTPVSNTIYHIAVTLSGSSISVSLSGTQRITTTDSFNVTATQHGLRVPTPMTGVYLDNFVISDGITGTGPSNFDLKQTIYNTSSLNFDLVQSINQFSNVQILIKGVDYTEYIQYDSISVDNNIVATNDTMSFNVEFDPDSDTLIDTNGNIIPATRPRCGQEVVWQNANVLITAPDGTQQPYRDFGGVISDVKEDVNGPNLLYQVQAKSYASWFDRHLVTGFFNQDNPENIIKNIVGKYCAGFTTYNVQTTDTQVATQYFDYKKPSEAVKDIADQLEMGFYIDNYKDTHFYDAESFTSPLPNNLLDVDGDVENYGDLELEENSDQVYTKVFLKGFKTRSNDFTLLTFVGNGSDNQWSLGYRPSSALGDVAVAVYTNIANYNSDTSFQGGGAPVNGVALTVKRDLVDGSPNQQSDPNVAYINYSEKLLRVPNYNSTGNLADGYVVAIRFYYLRDMVYLGQDPSASSAIAAIEGTDGVYEFAQTDKSLTNSTLSAAQSKSQLLLMKYGHPQIKGTFNTYFDATNSSGWIAGQYFTLRTQRRFGGLNEIMFVQRVTKSVVKNDQDALIVLYTIEFADTQYLV